MFVQTETMFACILMVKNTQTSRTGVISRIVTKGKTSIMHGQIEGPMPIW